MTQKTCYSCGRTPAPHKLQKTATSLIEIASDARLCSACHAARKGGSYWYWDQSLNEWIQRSADDTIWLISEKQQFPKLAKGDKIRTIKANGKPLSLPTFYDLATVLQLREWLLNPPPLPFLIAINPTGSEHLSIWVKGGSRNQFPVAFEGDMVLVDRLEFSKLLKIYECLLKLGFTQTEIDNYQYPPEKTGPLINQFINLEPIIYPHRDTPLFRLISFVAQMPEELPPVEAAAPQQPQGEQLTLFTN